MRWFGEEDINLNEADNSVKLLGWLQEEEGRGQRGAFAVCVFAQQHVCRLVFVSVCSIVTSTAVKLFFFLQVRKKYHQRHSFPITVHF